MYHIFHHFVLHIEMYHKEFVFCKKQKNVSSLQIIAFLLKQLLQIAIQI